MVFCCLEIQLQGAADLISAVVCAGEGVCFSLRLFFQSKPPPCNCFPCTKGNKLGPRCIVGKQPGEQTLLEK